MFCLLHTMSVPLKLYPRQSTNIEVNRNEKTPCVQNTRELMEGSYWIDFSEFENFSGTMTWTMLEDDLK